MVALECTLPIRQLGLERPDRVYGFDVTDRAMEPRRDRRNEALCY
jgi:hypothetical protein